MAGYSRAAHDELCEQLGRAKRAIYQLHAKGVIDGFELAGALASLDAQESAGESKLRMIARAIGDRAIDKHRRTHVTEPRGGMPIISPTVGASHAGKGLQPGLSVPAPAPMWRGRKA